MVLVVLVGLCGRRPVVWNRITDPRPSAAKSRRYLRPLWYQLLDVTFRECMDIACQTKRPNGIPTNQVWIQYPGTGSSELPWVCWPESWLPG